MHPDVAAVMQELDAHRARFIVFCRSLSPEELEQAVPGSEWQVRDFIAHLATIDGPVAATFIAIQENQQRESGGDATSPWDVDRWNQGRVEQRRGKSVNSTSTTIHRSLPRKMLDRYANRHCSGRIVSNVLVWRSNTRTAVIVSETSWP